MDKTLILLYAGLLGVVVHSVIKAQTLSNDAAAANLPFKFTDYLKKDYLGIILSFLAVLVWLLLFDEVAVKYDSLQNFVRLSFFAMGALGSYIIQLALSRAKQAIRKKVDVATNELDAIKSGDDHLGV